MKIILLILAVFTGAVCGAQEKLVKDLDGDQKADTTFLDADSRIVCKLSTAGFKPVASKILDLPGDQNGVRSTKSGFECYSSYMRGGSACQFRYDAAAKKIQLIGMSEYNFGNAANDGSGEGSVNLLTNMYVGNWNFFDDQKEKLIKMPTINEKMVLGKIYLDKFETVIYDNFSLRSGELYTKWKAVYNK